MKCSRCKHDHAPMPDGYGGDYRDEECFCSNYCPLCQKNRIYCPRCGNIQSRAAARFPLCEWCDRLMGY